MLIKFILAFSNSFWGIQNAPETALYFTISYEKRMKRISKIRCNDTVERDAWEKYRSACTKFIF